MRDEIIQVIAKHLTINEDEIEALGQHRLVGHQRLLDGEARGSERRGARENGCFGSGSIQVGELTDLVARARELPADGLAGPDAITREALIARLWPGLLAFQMIFEARRA